MTEVDITWGRAIRVWWAYLWRSLIAIVLAGIAGFVAGFIIGFVMGSLGIQPATIQVFATTAGLLIGLAFSIPPMKMILGKRFGDFRLVLVANH